MTLNEKCALSLIAIIGILMFAWAYIHAGGSLNPTNLVDLTPETLDHEMSIVPVDDKVLHFCPEKHLSRTVKNRQNYPNWSGMNLTLMIHRGFAPLMQGVKDGTAGWYDCPPTDVTGL